MLPSAFTSYTALTRGTNSVYSLTRSPMSLSIVCWSARTPRVQTQWSPISKRSCTKAARKSLVSVITFDGSNTRLLTGAAKPPGRLLS